MATNLIGRWLKGTRQRLRELRIPSIVRELERTAASRESILAVVARLRTAWGNPKWSADLGYLQEVVARSLESSGPFLECGCGLSTIVLGALAKRSGADVWSLEQDAAWARRVQARVRDLGLHNVHVVHAPLEVTDGAVWYAFDDGRLPRAFPVVFCDGPSVRKSQWPHDVYRAWRSELVPQLHRRAIAFGSIVLDDAEDDRCGDLIEKWRRTGLRVDVKLTPFGRHVIAERSLEAADERATSA